MSKWLKILLGVLVALLLALLLAAWLLPRFVDSTALKQRLASEASAATGLPVRIVGELGVSVFPRLSIQVGGLNLGDPDKPNETTASIDQGKVQVALMPLLKGQLLVKGLQLDGMELFYRDPQAGIDLRFGEASVSTGAVDLRHIANAGIPLEISALLEDAGSGFSQRFELDANAWIDPEAQLYRFEQLELRPQMTAEGGPPLRISSSEAALDLAAQTLTLDELKLALAGLELAGQIQVTDLMSQPRFKGRLASQPFSPRALLESLGQELPETADETVLSNAQWSASLEGSESRLALKQIELKLDDSRINGEFLARNPDRPDFEFSLDIDRINLDRYLPPADTQPDAAPDQPPAIALPLGGLTRVRTGGTIRIGQLQAMGVALTRAEVRVSSADGMARLHPITAELYGGRYSGDIRIEATGNTPIISFDENLQAVDLGELAKQWADVNNISGTATARIQGVGAGLTTEALISSLGGAMSLKLDNGALEGVDVWHQVRTALALLRGTPDDSADNGRTVFTSLQLDADIDNGLVSTESLTAQLPFLNLTGRGVVDLNRLDMDLGLVATVRKLPELQDDPVTSGLTGRSLPLRIKGPLSAPVASVDAGEVLRGELGTRLLDRLLGGDKPAKEEPTEDP